jgi:hypothetical protein
MTMETTTANTRMSRMRVPRSRGALGGFLVLILGAWAAIVPFIGPYLNFAYTPATNTAWHWTAARGWLEVAPGAAAFLGGLLMLVSASRAVASFGGWLAVAGGAWLVVGPPLAGVLSLNMGTPDPTSSTGVQAMEALFFFYAVGAAIILFAALALGRLSVLSLRDARAAERRAAAESAAMTPAAGAPAAETAGTAPAAHHDGTYTERMPADREAMDTTATGTTAGSGAAASYPHGGTAGEPAYSPQEQGQPVAVPHREGMGPDAPPPPEARR